MKLTLHKIKYGQNGYIHCISVQSYKISTAVQFNDIKYHKFLQGFREGIYNNIHTHEWKKEKSIQATKKGYIHLYKPFAFYITSNTQKPQSF